MAPLIWNLASVSQPSTSPGFSVSSVNSPVSSLIRYMSKTCGLLLFSPTSTCHRTWQSAPQPANINRHLGPSRWIHIHWVSDGRLYCQRLQCFGSADVLMASEHGAASFVKLCLHTEYLAELKSAYMPHTGIQADLLAWSWETVEESTSPGKCLSVTRFCARTPSKAVRSFAGLPSKGCRYRWKFSSPPTSCRYMMYWESSVQLNCLQPMVERVCGVVYSVGSHRQVVWSRIVGTNGAVHGKQRNYTAEYTGWSTPTCLVPLDA